MATKKKIKAIQFGHNADVIYEIDTGDKTVYWGEIKGTIDSQADLKTKLDSKVNSSAISQVALSGSYNDLTDKPTIPSKTSELTNDSNFTDKTYVDTGLSNKADKSELTPLATKQEVTDALLLKADKTDLDVKADKTTVESALSLKADKTELTPLATKQELSDGLLLKADKADSLSGYGITDAYTKQEVDSKLVGAYKYKGSVNTYEDLIAITEKAVGDVYNVINEHKTEPKFSAGSNFAWNGTEWDILGGTLDLTEYAKIEYVDSEVSIKADKTELTPLATKQEVSDGLSTKADKSTTLAGYGIEDAYTKTSMDVALGLKQNALTEAQLSAVDSGISAVKVEAYDEHKNDTTIHITAEEKETWNKVTNKADISALDTEVTNRTNGDANTLTQAKAYTDTKCPDLETFFDTLMPIGIKVINKTPSMGLWKKVSTETFGDLYERVLSLGTTIYDNTGTAHLDIDLTGNESFSFDDPGEEHYNKDVAGDLVFTMTSVKNSYFDAAFNTNTGVTSATFTNLTTINEGGLNSMFWDATAIKKFSFPVLTTIKQGGLSNCFSGSAVTGDIEFPALTTIDEYAFDLCFHGCKIDSLSFPVLKTTGVGGLSGMFDTNSSGYLKALNLPLLETIENEGMRYFCNACSGLTSLEFPSLKTIGSSGMENSFYGVTTLKSVKFPSLTTVATDAFSQTFKNCPLTDGIHFPSALEGNEGITADKLDCDESKIFFDL